MTLATWVLLAAILVLFLDDFIRLWQKFASTPVVRWLMPLCLMSMAAVWYESSCIKVSLFLQASLHKGMLWLYSLLPAISWSGVFAQASILCAASLIPVGLYEAYHQQQGKSKPRSQRIFLLIVLTMLWFTLGFV